MGVNGSSYLTVRMGGVRLSQEEGWFKVMQQDELK